MKRGEVFQVGVALVLVLATSLACKRKKEDSSSTSTASTAAVETATAEPSVTAADSAVPTPTTTTKVAATTTTTTTTAAVPAKSTYKVGENVTVMWQGQPYAASILTVLPNDKYKIHYTGWGSNWDETVGLDRIVGAKTGVAATAHAAGGGGGGGGGGGTKTSSADAPCPGPGITRRCNGVCVNLQTDDNNCGGCGTKCPSGKHCDGHLFCRDAEGNL